MSSRPATNDGFDGKLPVSDGELDRSGEEQWRRLRQQLELAGGCWLGFVFVPSPRQAAILRLRTEQLLRVHARTTKVLSPSSPDELGSLLPMLFTDDARDAGCSWIECVRSDPPTAEAGLGPWASAWDNLLMRANERRERIFRHLSGGLVFAAPPEIKLRARNAAPDLWSVRSLVLELDPTPAPRSNVDDLEMEFERSKTLTEVRVDAPDPEFSLAEAERRAAHGSSEPRNVV